ncbi:hypothetical protein [Aeoliella sp. SH292]|uniref:hypothetical protein n=1 Tax=Aeoliella sp. SH292 TaxID=3454464 RepID=UPI003F984D98
MSQGFTAGATLLTVSRVGRVKLRADPALGVLDLWSLMQVAPAKAKACSMAALGRVSRASDMQDMAGAAMLRGVFWMA